MSQQYNDEAQKLGLPGSMFSTRPKSVIPFGSDYNQGDGRRREIKAQHKDSNKPGDEDSPAAEVLVDEEGPLAPMKQEKKRRVRKKREITRCPHTHMQHYAKGMCNHCYHVYGRNGKATRCEHTDRSNYAKGLC